jgi:hypothetical protein
MVSFASRFILAKFGFDIDCVNGLVVFWPVTPAILRPLAKH